MKDLSTPILDASRRTFEEYCAEIEHQRATSNRIDLTDWTDQEIEHWLTDGVLPAHARRCRPDGSEIVDSGEGS